MPENNTSDRRIEALSHWVLERLTPKAVKRLRRYPFGGKTARSLQRLLTKKAEKEWNVSKSTAIGYAEQACVLVSTKILSWDSTENSSLDVSISGSRENLFLSAAQKTLTDDIKSA